MYITDKINLIIPTSIVKRWVLSILSIVLMSCTANPSKLITQDRIYHIGEEGTSRLSEVFDKAITEAMKTNHIPGVGFVVVQDGKTIYKKGYGIANMATGDKVDPDKSIFRIGSISKALTLLTLSRLVDQGRVNLDDDVTKYFDHMDNSMGFKDPVTIAHVLTHTSGFDQVGLGRHIYDYELSLDDRKAQRGSISDFLKDNNLRRITKPGAYFRYDTYGATLAGAIIEQVTGLPYNQAMKKELFDVIGMDRTAVEVNNAYMDDLAMGHGYNEGQYEVMPYEVYQTTPASSIDATPADMGRLLEVLTGDGSNGRGRLFSKDMMNKIRQIQYQPHPEFVGISHGLWQSNYIGNLPDAYAISTLGHGGDMLGTSGLMTTIPSMNIGLYITINRNDEGGGERVNIGRLVMPLLMEYLQIEKNAEPFELPSTVVNVDLTEYAGKYYFGVFCHSCTDEEYSRYAWRRSSRPHVISLKDDALLLGDDQYIPRGGDVFVRADGYEKIFFGRDEIGKISFMVFSDGLNSFERMDD